MTVSTVVGAGIIHTSHLAYSRKNTSANVDRSQRRHRISDSVAALGADAAIHSSTHKLIDDNVKEITVCVSNLPPDVLLAYDVDLESKLFDILTNLSAMALTSWSPTVRSIKARMQSRSFAPECSYSGLTGSVN
jgi:hypothetical protein